MADEHAQSRLARSPGEVLEDLIFQRRSIRKYQDRSVPEDWLDAMLRCAHQAPSPSNRQPVRFIRIASRQYKDRLKQSLARGHDAMLDRHRSIGAPARLKNRINVYRRYADIMFAAPVLLAVGVSMETMGFADHLAAGGLKARAPQSSTDLDITVGLALQGLMLKAQAMGVGSCILTAPLVFIDDIERLLGLKEMKIKCFLTLGFADETPGAPARMPLDAVRQVL